MQVGLKKMAHVQRIVQKDGELWKEQAARRRVAVDEGLDQRREDLHAGSSLVGSGHVGGIETLANDLES
jgi:hypothetical protein